MIYRIREKLAYSIFGKKVATLIRNKCYPHARVHWVQQAMADASLSRLPRA
jgi:hypothetical protein